MSKHTPGPWKILDDPDGWEWIVKGDYELSYYKGEFSGVIGTICCIGDLEAIDWIDHANARLIAAAPDLLTVLEELIEELAQYGDIGWYDMPSKEKGEDGRLVTRALTAIEKAKGDTL